MSEPEAAEKEPVGAVWVTSQPDDQGIYHINLEVGSSPREEIPLDADSGIAWAQHVIAVVSAAEYEAAVLRQLSTVAGREAALHVLAHLRSNRPASIPDDVVPALRLVPGVDQDDGLGFVLLEHRGATIGQWYLDDARRHATGVLESLAIVDLDTAYARYAVEEIGLSQRVAYTMVSELYALRLEAVAAR